MSEEKSTISLLPLQYHNQLIRTHIDTLGHLWWVAQDVCDVLMITEARQSLRRHPENEKGVFRIHTPGGVQFSLFVNEPGLYRLIFQSRKPEAETLKRWVFHEVLPTLRRTGSYSFLNGDQHKASPHLPPPQKPVQEMAHVSEMLLAVWVTLRQAEDPVTNAEIAQSTRVPLRTVQRHTKYLLQLGVIDLYETRPQHLFMLAAQAEKRAAGYYQRLERIAAIMAKRQQRLFA